MERALRSHAMDVPILAQMTGTDDPLRVLLRSNPDAALPSPFLQPQFADPPSERGG